MLTLKTEYIQLNGGAGDSDKIKRAAAVLEQGGLVAFPTETVYGIGCAAKPKSIERLNEVKGRTAGKFYTLHISSQADLDRFVPNIPFRAAKLVGECWPGPVTVVFELDEEALNKQKKVLGEESFSILYNDGTIGIRCPDNKTAGELLSLAHVPVVAPSANISSHEPALTGKEVLEQFDGQIDIVLDGGADASRCRQSSTVVKVTSSNLTVLREGVYGESEIKEFSLVKILFVCTGNTCRSPMAEGFCRKYISEKTGCNIDEIEKIGYKVGSAGVAAADGFPASPEVIEICEEKGIDMSSHRSLPASYGALEESDYVFAMSRHHVEVLERICPSAKDKYMLLDGTADITDPIGGSKEVYENCAKQIELALEKRLSEILT